MVFYFYKKSIFLEHEFYNYNLPNVICVLFGGNAYEIILIKIIYQVVIRFHVVFNNYYRIYFNRNGNISIIIIINITNKRFFFYEI